MSSIEGMALGESLPSECTVRCATPSDIPALLSLLLTSFRQFPLFDILYSPIHANIDYARDTVFFWRRRLLLDLLNPRCTILVAVKAVTDQPRTTAVDAQSSWMLEWVLKEGLQQVTGKDMIVGFAIWKVRGSGRENGSDLTSWWNWSRMKQINLELAFWSKIYVRKDQDLAKYEAYIAGEEELEHRFYKEPCYFLDNLAVDFRFQRQGVGAALVQKGLKTAGALRLPAQTEAGPAGEGLYHKLGFETIGMWDLSLPGAATLSLPVMKREFSAGTDDQTIS